MANEDSRPVQDQLHEHLDSYFGTLEEQWHSPLCFEMHTGITCATDDSTLLLDLCAFIRDAPETSSITGNYAYFSRQLFPVPTSENESLKSLQRALFDAALQSGFTLTCNGNTCQSKSLAKMKKFPLCSAAPTDAQTFICSKYNQYKKKRKRKDDSGPSLPYRDISLHNDKKGNSRGPDGLKGPRKTVTNRSLSKEATCSFRFTVYVDKYGFYVKRKAGCTIHCNHMRRMPKDIPLRLKNFTDTQKEQAAKLGNAYTRPASARTYFHANENMTVTPGQMRYAFRKWDAEGKYHFDGVPLGAPQMVEWLRTTPDISYCIWGAQPPSNSDVAFLQAAQQRHEAVVVEGNQNNVAASVHGGD